MHSYQPIPCLSTIIPYPTLHCFIQILDGLKFQLHKQYSAFMKHHPHFLSNGGTVSIIGHSLGSVITYDLLLHTAECMGVDVSSGETPPTSAGNSPSLSKPTMAVGASSSRASGKSRKAVQLGDGKAGGAGGDGGGGGGRGGGGVRFDPSVASLEASLKLDGEDEGESMVIGEDEPGEGVCVCARACACTHVYASSSNIMAINSLT